MNGSDPAQPPARRPAVGLVLAIALVAVLAGLIAVVDSADPTVSCNSSRDEGVATTSSPSVTATSGAPTTTTVTTTPRPTTTTGAARTTTTTTRRTTSSALATPTAATPLRLWVGGDSLAAGPSWAVFVAAKSTGVVKPLAEYQVGTGLVRNEFWDWPKHMDAVVRARDPQVSVFMVGANDDQGIEVDGTSHKPPDPQWSNEYRRRVASVMKTLTAGGRRLIWIGMPPMRDAAYSNSMGLLDDIMKDEAAKHPRVAYVDAWTMFSVPGAAGTYAQSVPNESGQLVDMRLDDGIHLNVEGSQRLARAVMAELGKVVTLPPS